MIIRILYKKNKKVVGGVGQDLKLTVSVPQLDIFFRGLISVLSCGQEYFACQDFSATFFSSSLEKVVSAARDPSYSRGARSAFQILTKAVPTAFCTRT